MNVRLTTTLFLTIMISMPICGGLTSWHLSAQKMVDSSLTIVKAFTLIAKALHNWLYITTGGTLRRVVLKNTEKSAIRGTAALWAVTSLGYPTAERTAIVKVGQSPFTSSLTIAVRFCLSPVSIVFSRLCFALPQMNHSHYVLGW